MTINFKSWWTWGVIGMAVVFALAWWGSQPDPRGTTYGSFRTGYQGQRVFTTNSDYASLPSQCWWTGKSLDGTGGTNPVPNCTPTPVPTSTPNPVQVSQTEAVQIAAQAKADATKVSQAGTATAIIAKAIGATATLRPTNTPLPSPTAQPTATPRPTNTPISPTPNATVVVIFSKATAVAAVEQVATPEPGSLGDTLRQAGKTGKEIGGFLPIVGGGLIVVAMAVLVIVLIVIMRKKVPDIIEYPMYVLLMGIITSVLQGNMDLFPTFVIVAILTGVVIVAWKIWENISGAEFAKVAKGHAELSAEEAADALENRKQASQKRRGQSGHNP